MPGGGRSRSELVPEDEYRPARRYSLGGDLLELREGKRSHEVRGIILGDAVELRGQVARPLGLLRGLQRARSLPRHRLGRTLASHISRFHLVSLLPYLTQADCAVKPGKEDRIL